MSDAKVVFKKNRFWEVDEVSDALAGPGEEAYFSFRCPKTGRSCGSLPIAGRVPGLKRDGQNQNGGKAQWDWANADKPEGRAALTFAPSINCLDCWHGYIEDGRCVDCSHKDEP